MILWIKRDMLFSLKSFEEGRISIFERRSRARGTTENAGIGEDSIRYFLQLNTAINGKQIGGRFGSALASLGDLDGDGYEDLVVGSPYENQGMGSIRIFYGMKYLSSLEGESKYFENIFLLLFPFNFIIILMDT